MIKTEPLWPQLAAEPPPPQRDRTTVFDALAFSQAPLTVLQLVDLIAVADLRSTRGSGFHTNEVRRLLGELAQQRLASCDERGRWSAQREAGWARFRAIVLDEHSRELWWRAWRARHNFERGYHLEIYDSATFAGAMRVVVHCGRSVEAFNRLTALAGPSVYAGQALHDALLAPFDAELLGRLEPAFAMGLASATLATRAGGDADAALVPLLDWLIARAASDPQSVPDHLHYRLADALLFREQFDAARKLLARFSTAESQAIGAGLDIAEGRFADGATRFEAALKTLAAETGRRKNLLPPALAWIYTMALLAQPEPAAWLKARKFAAAEAGKRDALPYTFWGIWQSAIDQRLGDAPHSRLHFELERAPGQPRHALEQLHHLLLAAWLRIEPGPRSACERLREHGDYLEARLRHGGQQWLARLTRRAVALLRGDGRRPTTPQCRSLSARRRTAGVKRWRRSSRSAPAPEAKCATPAQPQTG